MSTTPLASSALDGGDQRPTLAPSSVSGRSSTVTQWVLSIRYFFSRGPKTSSPLDRRAFAAAKSDAGSS